MSEHGSIAGRAVPAVFGVVALACVVSLWGCARKAEEPPLPTPPRVYEQGECAAVMRLPGMSVDDIVGSVVSLGVTALQNRRRVVADWNRMHQGHWVRWSVVVRPRDPQMLQQSMVIVRCPDQNSRIVLEGLSATVGAMKNRLRGGERLRVVGWLDERGLVTGACLRAESIEIEAEPAAASAEDDAGAGVPDVPARPDASVRRPRRSGERL